MQPQYINSSKGFGLKPCRSTLSPYAQLFLPNETVKQLPCRSQLRYSLIYRDMMEMGTNPKVIDDRLYRYVRARAFKAFSITPVKPRHMDDIMNDPKLDIRQSSPGIPWQPLFKTRGDVFNSSIARHSITTFWSMVRRGAKVAAPDCKVLYRAHLEKEDGSPKIRAVYGYPTTITVGEAQFALPLIKGYINDRSTPMAYGFDMATGGALRLRHELSPYGYYGCFDFSSFDKSVTKQLIDDAFDILLSNLDLDGYEGGGVANMDGLLAQFDYIKEYFLQTPLRMPNGDRYRKSAGVPSGSYFTQLIDSIVNWLLINYVYLKAFGRMPKFVKVFGDDSVIADDTAFSKWKFCEYMAEYTGMEIHPHKSITTTRVDCVEFLGFNIANGFPQRSYNKWINLLAHPEWPDQEWDDFASRAVGLFYANTGTNTEFDALCRKIVKTWPFRMKFSRSMLRMVKVLGLSIDEMTPNLPCKVEMLCRALA
uniref:RNA-dependent RNA polymerase n=1 Tax=Crocidura shantungensis ribovirus 6 TaxID=3139541 RepID=A0AB38ZK53_9VIRU